MDGLTDKGKVENELIIIQYCTVNEKVEEVRSLTRFLRVVKPVKADADGLIVCLGEGLKVMGIISSNEVLDVEGHSVLVSGGTDSATVNISDQNGSYSMLYHGYIGHGTLLLIVWSKHAKIHSVPSCLRTLKVCYSSCTIFLRDLPRSVEYYMTLLAT